ncbi:hypothetical protein N9W34_05875 [Rickettsiales bacterium]|nr:hypothetical protein [Rickettsiales bacterium]
MKNYKLKTAIILATLIIPASAMSQGKEKDPFMPFVWDTPVVDSSKSGDGKGSKLTKEHPLSSYRLTGLAVGPEDAIAIITSKEGKEYFVTVGDSIGNENGIVESIRLEGVTIKAGNEKIEMVVDNKFGLQNESN